MSSSPEADTHLTPEANHGCPDGIGGVYDPADPTLIGPVRSRSDEGAGAPMYLGSLTTARTTLACPPVAVLTRERGTIRVAQPAAWVNAAGQSLVTRSTFFPSALTQKSSAAASASSALA